MPSNNLAPKARISWIVVIVIATLLATLIFGHFKWFKDNEHIALWLEGVALVLIFGLDYRNRQDEAEEYKLAHQETLRQLTLLGQQAQAASDTATAAKKSADLTAALHRPYVGLDRVNLLDGAVRYVDLLFSLKNFGTLPAFNVGFEVQCFVEGELRSRHREATAIQIFPSDTLSLTYRFDAGDPDGPLIRDGKKKFSLLVLIPYQTENARQFEYTADLSYAPGRIAIDKSTTASK